MAESVDEDIFDLDIDVLITLVKRPALWDKTLESYKSKTETSGAWREICMRMNPNFEQLYEAEKNKYGKTLIKKWTNLRDRYTKYLKKVQEQSSTGSKAKTVKKYIYSEQMSFLRENVIKNYTVSSLDITQEGDQVNIEADQLSQNNDASAIEIDCQTTAPNRKRGQPKYPAVEKKS